MSETDRRLKDYLNTNQAARERMCLEILSVQEGYSDVSPRLPKGGPDGSRDIQSFYRDDLCFGAVGFVNDAGDGNEHRKQIKKKFKEDLKNALSEKKDGTPPPKAFVFLTNVGLTPGIISELKEHARGKGISYCDIFDREILRVALDSNRGYAIRHRYLDISLSDAEQKEFFTAWGDKINSIIGSGLKDLHKTTKRIQFLMEAQFTLDHLATVVRLDSNIWEACEGEFFFQTMLSLRVHSDGLLGITFGGGTKKIQETLAEWQARGKKHTKNSEFGFGFSWLIPNTPHHARYVRDVNNLEHPKNINGEEKLDYVRTSGSSGILEVDQKALYFKTLSEPFIERYQPTCKLQELDGCMLLFESSREIAEHIEEIAIIAGGYELLTIKKGDFELQPGSFERLKLPKEAKQEPDSHDWVTVRPSGFPSCFSIDLMGRTPRRYDW
ncbi:hypothetical protein PVW53_17660 [Seohaeicola sp. SP36]|uniref:hypothetical protein n=1 Tax=unclassified Seohaeicola TaxID=2641111 RepID=UPI00237A5910|nr:MULTISPECIES: hypothetical protein [unclassified Seohaeicola]MDD9709147.1 hypothetical protein [Seohaeicola sp. 4SK31]MDD9737354.1 hypothetical protein [Seohaeicola sp. SP36]